MNSSPTIQDIIMQLNQYWHSQGCMLMNPYDVETGAGTMNPMTTQRVVGPEEWNSLLAYLKEMQTYHRFHTPDVIEYPTRVTRSLVEEATGEPFELVEKLNVYEEYVTSAKT